MLRGPDPLSTLDDLVFSAALVAMEAHAFEERGVR
jgi:hypothetical protein